MSASDDRSRPSLEQRMKDAVIARNKANARMRATFASCKFLQHTKTAKQDKTMISPDEASLQWDECNKAQTEGAPITYKADQLKTKEKSGKSHDISIDIKHMFASAISYPARKLRNIIEKHAHTTQEKEAWNEILKRVVIPPMRFLFKMSDNLGNAMLRHLKDQGVYTRHRRAFNRVLMYISDCYRYSSQFVCSREVAELMRVLEFDDGEAHMRIALNIAVLGGLDSTIQTFYHYCFFISARSIPPDHAEVDVASRYVEKTLREFSKLPRKDLLLPQTQFSFVFIEVIWAFYMRHFDAAKEKVGGDRLWDALKRVLDSAVATVDMLHIVGILIFTHDTVCVHTTETTKAGCSLHPQVSAAETLVARTISCMAEASCVRLQKLLSVLNNRHMHMRPPYKRRIDGTPVIEENIGWKLLDTDVTLKVCAPHIGALTILAKYWYKARTTPGLDADLESSTTAMRTMSELYDLLDCLLHVTSCKTFSSIVEDKARSQQPGILPAEPEDILLYRLKGCIKSSVMSGVQVPGIPITHILKSRIQHGSQPTIGEVDYNMVQQALSRGERTYEEITTGVAERHRLAFAKRCLAALGWSPNDTRAEGLSKAVTVAIWRYRTGLLLAVLKHVTKGNDVVVKNNTKALDPGCG